MDDEVREAQLRQTRYKPQKGPEKPEFNLTPGKVLLPIVVMFFVILYSPDPVSEDIRGVIVPIVENTLENSAQNAKKGYSTPIDRALANVLLFSRTASLYFNAPEASKLVWHFCKGSGVNLELRPALFRDSVVVRRLLPELKPGNPRKVVPQPTEDPELAAAFTEFSIMKVGTSTYQVKQKVAFDPNAAGKAEFKLGRMTFKVTDTSLVVLGCKPFDVYSEWRD
jgi:hypothetical protein